MAYLYHFVIMFEALFILTLLETGTRVARFILQELLGRLSESSRPNTTPLGLRTSSPASSFAALWGYLLYQFDIGRLWLLNGIGNQLLAAIGLAIGTTYLLAYAPKRKYALCTAIPFVAVTVTVFLAGIESLSLWWSQQAARAHRFGVVFSFRLMCFLVCVFLLLGVVITSACVRRWWELLANGGKSGGTNGTQVLTN